MNFEKCEVCDMVFHDVGTLLGRKRLIHHRRIKHRAECENCGKRFVSTTHVAVHKFLSHDIICSRCGEACEGNCLELIASEIEKAGEEEMKIEQKKLEDRIRDSEELIMNHFSEATKRQMAMLAECAWFLDIGQSNCNSTNWGMLVYFPSIEISMFGLSEFSRKYIHDHVHMSALEKLKMYFNRLNREGVPKQIDQYVQFCMSFYSENTLLEMTPEQLEGGRFCLPEREVRYWPSNQWEITRQKESSVDTEARKIGEIEEETTGNQMKIRMNLLFTNPMMKTVQQ